LIVEGKDRIFCKKETLNCSGQLIDLSTPKVMGILNVTPDSFHDGGKYNNKQLALERAEEMLTEGVDMIDIGGYSSRPGAGDIDESEERERVIPCIRALITEFPDLILSIDTFRSGLAKEAVGEGASMINDISGGSLDSGMFSTVAQMHVPYILMHMRGTPQDMQLDTEYENLIGEIVQYFQQRLVALRDMGVNDVIIDPGFGFGKSLNDNHLLLHQLKSFEIFELPMLAGLSRKSMIQKLMGKGKGHSLKGTMGLNLIALMEGTSILRVHDVKEAKAMVELYQHLTRH